MEFFRRSGDRREPDLGLLSWDSASFSGLPSRMFAELELGLQARRAFFRFQADVGSIGLKFARFNAIVEETRAALR